MGRATVKIRCLCCRKPGLHMARGLIIACYTRHQRAGTLDQYPISEPTGSPWKPTGRIGASTLNRYIAMEVRGFSPARIRFELGLSARQVNRYAQVAKEQREQRLAAAG